MALIDLTEPCEGCGKRSYHDQRPAKAKGSINRRAPDLVCVTCGKAIWSIADTEVGKWEARLRSEGLTMNRGRPRRRRLASTRGRAAYN